MEGVIGVTGGTLRGVEEGGVWVFRGVPYAHSPPSGRWAAPHPPEPWRGIRDALTWGPIAPQTAPVPGFSLPGDPTHADENCLNLNVWTPRPGDRRRPVMVWIHGGGFTTGTGASTLFAGHHLAAKGVVVVTFNYRLGALGLLAHPGLTDVKTGGWGNWALLDQLAALTWVRDNIAAFGGDPDNVTLFGESAGAMSICDLLPVPAAADLFHRAVIQSGPPAVAEVEWAITRAGRLMGHLGLSTFDVDELRRAPAVQLVSATQRLAAEIPGDGGLPLPLLPVVDGGLIDRFPGDSIVDGAAAAVPLLVGTTRDESALFTVADWTNPDLDVARVVRRLAHFVEHEAAAAIVEAYRDARAARDEPVSGHHLWTALTTDYVFRLPILGLLSAHQKYQTKVFSYLFTRESPFMGGAFGSCHGLEIPFVFGTVENPAIQVFTGSDPAGSALSEQMQNSWIAFGRTDDPSCEEVGEWPAFDPVQRSTMVFGPDGGLQDDPRRPERVAWEEAGVALPLGHDHR